MRTTTTTLPPSSCFTPRAASASSTSSRRVRGVPFFIFLLFDPFAAIGDFVQGAWHGAATILEGFANSVKQGLGTPIGNAGTTITNTAATLGDKASSAGSAIVTASQAAARAALGLSESAWRLLTDPITFVKNLVVDAFGSLFQLLGNGLAGAAAFVNGALRTAWAFFGNAFTNIGTWFSNAFVDTGTFIGNAFTNTTSAISTAFPAAGPFAPVLATAFFGVAAAALVWSLLFLARQVPRIIHVVVELL